MLDALAQNIMVSHRARIPGKYLPEQAPPREQAIKLAGMFRGLGGPIITIARGQMSNTNQIKKRLAVGYDGVVVGRAVMGSASAPVFIQAVRDRTLLLAEFSQWGLDNVEFDVHGNVMHGPKKDIPSAEDDDVFL